MGENSQGVVREQLLCRALIERLKFHAIRTAQSLTPALSPKGEGEGGPIH